MTKRITINTDCNLHNNRSFYILLVLPIIFLFVSCNSDMKRLREISKERISLNLSKLELVTTDSSLTYETHYKQIVYMDNIQCASCITNKLLLWKEFEKVAKNKNPYYSLCIIIASDNKNVNKQIKRICYYTKFDSALYIDTIGLFLQDNPFLRNTSIKESFLVDSIGDIKLIGSPINNKRINSLVLDYISKR